MSRISDNKEVIDGLHSAKSLDSYKAGYWAYGEIISGLLERLNTSVYDMGEILNSDVTVLQTTLHRLRELIEEEVWSHADAIKALEETRNYEA